MLTPATICLDTNSVHIGTVSDFAKYLSLQVNQNVIVSMQGLQYAVCLNWPNLTDFHVEKYRDPFPKSIKNKILVIGETNNPYSSYKGSIATYEYIGSDNAIFLIHDGVGEGIYQDPNNCTYDAIREFFLTGNVNLFSYIDDIRTSSSQWNSLRNRSQRSE